MGDVQDRAMAAFLGFALGDALGATVEFLTPREIAARHGLHSEIIGGGWLKLKPGAVTDDTQMALVLGRSLIARQGFDAKDICCGFAAWLKSGPADVGNTCRRGIRRFLEQGTVEGPYAEDDAGNGAAMRVLPVALATLGHPERAAAWTVAQAHATHNHPLSDAACVALVRMVQGLVLGAGGAVLAQEAEALIAQHRDFRFVPYRGRSSAFVVETLQTVLHYTLSSESFEEVLTGTVNQGGDADTTGALAGMLAGARGGMAALPPRWLAALDPAVTAEIRAQVPQLLALAGISDS
ncbi:ADP-ribosyl-[dinitrogen reductase] hydrolase [Rhodobacter capsulatus]|uniref:ADP-ribosyl-[dinitrogen reductase] hydrolase n=1 Tax=Rhodobacter capsulatus TaxID=1061 RepID=A0A1G7MTP2_RHOCA|nr:ADP-ribosyl-[dinitrogen reductase] hydrolase [Rhodobacter capsulatus]WER08838.1 ADP-ribosyl-[dinitrogen reductase] hydrolase [Rhodobacter capsulatus]SDF65185.1 ADP-ribosyl-[dinitrogen reductase] hydrolase [Rhodobacter capsulatus]